MRDLVLVKWLDHNCEHGWREALKDKRMHKSLLCVSVGYIIYDDDDIIIIAQSIWTGDDNIVDNQLTIAKPLVVDIAYMCVADEPYAGPNYEPPPTTDTRRPKKGAQK